jgi:hypothetical protein
MPIGKPSPEVPQGKGLKHGKVGLYLGRGIYEVYRSDGIRSYMKYASMPTIRYSRMLNLSPHQLEALPTKKN